MSSSTFSAGGAGGAYIAQFIAQTSVTITHNWKTYPIVDVVDDTGTVLIPLSIVHNNADPTLCTATTVTFDVAKSGRIVISYGALKGDKGDQGIQGIPGTAGAFFTISVITGDTNAVKDYLYVLTGNATIVLTLPASPSVNDKIAVVNLTSVLTCSVARNGNNIMGSATDLTLDKANAGFTMIYSGATNGWVII